jgi:DNA-binding protein Fis
MKRIVAFVLPADGAADAGLAAPAAGEAWVLSDGASSAPVDSGEGSMKLEAVVSDNQAQRFVAALLDHDPADEDGLILEDLLRKELASAGPDAHDLFQRIVLGVERQLISQVYAECDRVKTRAAARLGINRNTLHKKLRQYQLISEDDEDE